MSTSSRNIAEVAAEVVVDISAGGDGSNVFNSSDNHPTYTTELTQLLQWADSVKSIRREVLNGCLEKSHFRSVVWQILLNILPHQSCLWVQKLRQLRNSYRCRRDILLVDPRSSPTNDNPLSQDTSSAWHQYFCDKELRSTIRKDVVRTSPDDKFFSSESIQNIMVNILFVYAREHQDICYRQGMHEVLAPLLLVLHADQQALIDAQRDTPVEGLILEVLDCTCLEEDAYWLLDGIMKHLASTYTILDVTPTSTGEFPYQSPKHTESESGVCSRMRRIRDNILAVWDSKLRQHLVHLDIPLYFGIRWLRVMFGQEFTKRNLLVLWDAILAADSHLGLVDYIVVAMLMIIRDRWCLAIRKKSGFVGKIMHLLEKSGKFVILVFRFKSALPKIIELVYLDNLARIIVNETATLVLEEDFYGCLDLLVHYPADIEVHSILRLALHLRKRKESPRPDDILVETKRAVGLRSPSISGKIRDFVSRPRPKTDSPSSTNIPSSKRSFKFRGNRFEEIDCSHSQHYSRVSSRNMDDSMELLTTLQNKVYLTSLRLAKYQVTLEQHLNTSEVPTSVLNAVDGVKEIAQVLEELGVPQSEVETAIEATQSQNMSASNSPDPVGSATDGTNKAPSPRQTSTSKPVSASNRDMLSFIELPLISERPTDSSPDLLLSNPLRNMSGTSDYEPLRQKSIYLQYQLLSNPLRNMSGTSDYEPLRQKSIYLQYQRVLGEGRIFARMKK